MAAVMLMSGLPVMADEAAVTRAYAVHSFVEAVGEENFPSGAADLSAFSDGAQVPEEYRDSLELAVANGIILGSGGALRPNEELTRVEALIILGRCLPDIEEKRPSVEFTDVPDWAAEEIDRLYRGEIVNGYGNGLLGSYDLISEEQLKLLTGRVENTSPRELSLKDDFYSAVNREFLESAVIPQGSSMFSPTMLMDEKVTDFLIRRSDELLAAKNSGGQITDMERNAALLYEKALNDGDGSFDYLNKYLLNIDDCDDIYKVGYMGGQMLRELSTPLLFDVTIPCRLMAAGGAEPLGGVYVSYVYTSIERTYWEEDPEGVTAAYEEYAREILDLLKVPDSGKKAAEIAAFQRDVALAGESYSQRMSSDDEDEEQFVFDWTELCDRFANGSFNPVTRTLFGIHSRFMTDWPAYVISDIDAVDKAVELINSTDLETVKALCKINFVEHFMIFMPKAYREASVKLSNRVFGFGADYEDKERAAEITSMIYTRAYENEYFEDRGDDIDEKLLLGLIDDITSTFEQKFRYSNYIAPSTSGSAIVKMEKMKKSIGIDTEHDSKRDENRYYKVDERDSLTDNGIRLYEYVSGDYTSVMVLVDSSAVAYTTNASYNPYVNKINIYGGIMQSPIYDPEASYEENLGGIGFVLAHEISHAFDGTGSNYNYKGNYSPWWSDDDYQHFEDFTEKLTKYYSGFENVYGQPVDGNLTSDENIADILAMECIIAIAKEKNLDLDKVFRAYAASWASVCTPEYATYLSRCDSHSPDKVRVNAVLSNFDEFYETYGIEEGDGMYVAPEDRVRFF